MLEIAEGQSLKLGLEFAPGTTEDCKKKVVSLFKPSEILGAYKQARALFKTGDLVLVGSETDPSGFNVEPRHEYLKRLRQVLGENAPKAMQVLGLAHTSAHAVVKMPKDSDAMWLVITRGRDMPLMVVLFTTPYQISEAN